MSTFFLNVIRIKYKNNNKNNERAREKKSGALRRRRHCHSLVCLLLTLNVHFSLSTKQHKVRNSDYHILLRVFCGFSIYILAARREETEKRSKKVFKNEKKVLVIKIESIYSPSEKSIFFLKVLWRCPWMCVCLWKLITPYGVATSRFCANWIQFFPSLFTATIYSKNLL